MFYQTMVSLPMRKIQYLFNMIKANIHMYQVERAIPCLLFQC